MPAAVSPEVDRNLKRLALRILDSLFPEQRAFVTSGSRRISACCTRRAAKTTSVAARHLVRCLTKPDARTLYLNMFAELVQRDFYINSVQLLLRNAGYRGHLPARLPFTFPNGSMMYGVGLDSSSDAKRKARGSQWDEVDIDEAQSWSADIESMIDSEILPTVRERRGTVAVTGTPGDVHGGFWHRLALGEVPGWEARSWSWRHNVYTRDAIAAEQAEELRKDPGKERTPAWQRENEGRWVIEDDLRVYHHGGHNLACDVLPPGDYLWGLAVDTGKTNPSAIVEMCYPRIGEQKVYITWAWKMPGMDAIELGEHIKRRYDSRPYAFKVIDPAAAQTVETINRRFGINLTSAKKGNVAQSKKDHIDFMNADLRRANVQVLPEAREALCGEWDRLVWDRASLVQVPREFVERAGLPNHCADAALYGYNECRHFWAQEQEERRPNPLIMRTPAMLPNDEEAYLRALDEREERRRNVLRGFAPGTRLL